MSPTAPPRGNRRKSYSAPLPRLTAPLVRDRGPDGRRGPLRTAGWDEALDRAAAGLAKVRDEQGPDGFAMFSCSKSTNEVNYAAQKFIRTAMGSNNIDSCNRT